MPEMKTLTINGSTYEIVDETARNSIPTNLVNGSAEGSMRTAGAKEEDSDYEMGMHASATGSNTVASEYASHAEGENTTASGASAHAEGYDTVASGYAAHTEGHATEASGYATHAEGYDTTASGGYSHAEGRGTIASRKFQHVQGAYNIADTTGSNTSAQGEFAHIVGNGDSDTSRSNAHTLDWDGNAWFAGDVYVGSTSGTNKDEGSKKLLKEGDVAVPTKTSQLTNDSEFVTSAHKHGASDITSGTLPLERGGTGATNAATARTNLGFAAESWTFTLEDGSTVTKKVVISA